MWKNQDQHTQLRYTYLADEPEQIATCAQWTWEAWGKYNPAMTVEKRAERFRGHCNKDALPLTVLCKMDGVMVGMASLRASEGLDTAFTPWLGSVYVAEAFREHGVGAELIRKMEDEARRLGFETLYLLTYEEALETWYASHGWKKAGDYVLFGNPVIVMEKQLLEGTT